MTRQEYVRAKAALVASLSKSVNMVVIFPTVWDETIHTKRPSEKKGIYTRNTKQIKMIGGTNLCNDWLRVMNKGAIL